MRDYARLAFDRVAHFGSPRLGAEESAPKPGVAAEVHALPLRLLHDAEEIGRGAGDCCAAKIPHEHHLAFRVATGSGEYGAPEPLAAAGAFALSAIGRSDYPEVAPTIVKVSTTYSGASPAVIADTVATPIENQVNSVENVCFFDSRCSDSGSYELFVTFLPGTSPDMNLVNVQNAVKRAEPKLPSEVLQVGLAVVKCSSDYAIQFVFTTDGREMDLVALGNFVNHEIKDALQRVRGVSSVSCSDTEYAMRIWLDTMKMDAFGVSVADVRAAVSGQNIQPAAGFVGNAMSSPHLSYKVNAPGRLVTPAEFEAIVVRTSPTDGSRVLLGDVARCELGAKSYTQEPRVNGSPCCLASAYADSEANTRDVARACRQAVEDWMTRAPKGVEARILHDQADYIDELLKNFAWLTAATVLLALLLFAACSRLSGGFVPPVIVSVSLLSGAVALWAAGWTLDVITAFAFLAGLVVALPIAAGRASFAAFWTFTRFMSGRCSSGSPFQHRRLLPAGDRPERA